MTLWSLDPSHISGGNVWFLSERGNSLVSCPSVRPSDCDFSICPNHIVWIFERRVLATGWQRSAVLLHAEIPCEILVG